jgi:hypothetical protein
MISSHVSKHRCWNAYTKSESKYSDIHSHQKLVTIYFLLQNEFSCHASYAGEFGAQHASKMH